MAARRGETGGFGQSRREAPQPGPQPLGEETRQSVELVMHLASTCSKAPLCEVNIGAEVRLGKLTSIKL